MKDKIVGSRADLGDICETRIMNRALRWTGKGWEYEADQRHAELITRGMHLVSVKAVKTAGGYVPSWKLDEDEEYLGASQSTQFRMLAARTTFMASGRTDMQFAVT